VSIRHDHDNDLVCVVLIGSDILKRDPNGVIERGGTSGAVLGQNIHVNYLDGLRCDGNLHECVKRCKREKILDAILPGASPQVLDELVKAAERLLPHGLHAATSILDKIHQNFAHRHLLFT